MSEFEGRSAIVTGAASGIGREIARILVERGAQVFAADLDPSAAPEGSHAVVADVSAPGDMDRVVSAALERTGRVDALFNNAGIGSTTNVLDCSAEEWDRLFAVNARGVFLGIKAALPSMLERGAGTIVNTASIAGLVGLRNRAAYCATKGAVIALTRQVAIQYAGTGIRCNCICPGTVDTPWVERLLGAADDPVAERATLVARQPIGRLGTPEEIAKAALYLASDDAAFATGTVLVIDGGLTAG